LIARVLLENLIALGWKRCFVCYRCIWLFFAIGCDAAGCRDVGYNRFLTEDIVGFLQSGFIDICTSQWTGNDIPGENIFGVDALNIILHSIDWRASFICNL
jgi:hypothetical protein